jgi:hypothetical protein
MVTFDAELYLRLLGERLLEDSDQQRHHHHRSPLDGPAAALVAADTIAPGLASRVIDDYAAAMRVRAGERGFPHFGPPARRRRPGHLTARHTRVLDREISFGAGQLLLRDLTIDENGGTLRFRWRRDAPGSSRGGSRMMGRPGGFPWRSRAPVIIDDQGHQLSVQSGSGGGPDDQWDGKLDRHGTLALDVAWLEVEGARIELDRRTTPWEARIEPVEDEDRLARFLWRRLAVPECPSDAPLTLRPRSRRCRQPGRWRARSAWCATCEQLLPECPIAPATCTVPQVGPAVAYRSRGDRCCAASAETTARRARSSLARSRRSSTNAARRPLGHLRLPRV